MRISDWSSDVCSSDLLAEDLIDDTRMIGQEDSLAIAENGQREARSYAIQGANSLSRARSAKKAASGALIKGALDVGSTILGGATQYTSLRSEEHTSELQSLMRTSYAVFFLKKKNKINNKR